MTEASTRELTPPLTDDDVDPELLGLPDPPKRERTLTVAMLIFTALASLAMIASLRHDAIYAFVGAEAQDLGDIGVAPAESFAENRHVRGRAMLGAAHAIRYERPLVRGSFRLMPVAGRPNVWAEVRVLPGAENVRWVPPGELTGRLVRFDAAGPKHRGLASAVEDATGQAIPKGAWLLVEGSAPADARWAVILILLFGGFAVWNLTAAAKLLRRVR